MKCPICENNIEYVINDKHFSGKPKKKIIMRSHRNIDGSINWKNLFYIQPEILLLVIGIVLLLFGFRHINTQCYDILEKPCEVIDQYDCTGEYKYPENSNIEYTFNFEKDRTLQNSTN